MTNRPTNRHTDSILVLCKKIRSKFAILRKLGTRTPVSIKGSNRSLPEKHTSGWGIFFSSDSLFRGLGEQWKEKLDQNLKKKFLGTCWVYSSCGITTVWGGCEKGCQLYELLLMPSRCPAAAACEERGLWLDSRWRGGRDAFVPFFDCSWQCSLCKK
jgi:hypothetical protein